MADETATPVEPCPHCKSGRETFYYLGDLYLFDVDRANQMVQDGREPVEVEDESVRHSIKVCRLYEQHVAHVDPSRPGIIAHVRYTTEEGELLKGHVLIDGHHRAARCVQLERPFFAYLLTEEESLAILLPMPREESEETEEGEDADSEAGPQDRAA